MSEKEYMTNQQGHLVPLDKVKPEDKIEDQLVTRLFETAFAFNADLRAFKASAFSDVNSLVELLGEKYGVKKGGRKGNMTLTSFDGLTRVEVSVAEFIQFGPQLQIAKNLIDECIKSWSDGINANIEVLINDAFKVDKTGRLNTGRILGLRRYSIDDPTWLKAMEAISEAVRVTGTKQYMRFFRRNSPEQPWQAVQLDFAAV